jgi:isocitrate dehydrogenase
VLKDGLHLQAGEVVDSAVMNVTALRAFFSAEIDAAAKDGTLLSLHLKATMMKVSDPIMFGHCVAVYYAEALEAHAQDLEQIGANLNHGIADVLAKSERLPADRKSALENAITAVYDKRPALAMVDSRHGITNLHVPNNIIIDASMPNVVRDGGRMWNANDELQDTVAMIPDRSYATMYQAIIEDCQQNDSSTLLRWAASRMSA